MWAHHLVLGALVLYTAPVLAFGADPISTCEKNHAPADLLLQRGVSASDVSVKEITNTSNEDDDKGYGLEADDDEDDNKDEGEEELDKVNKDSQLGSKCEWAVYYWMRGEEMDDATVACPSSGQLTVKVERASQLNDEDWWSGDSDAYVVLYLNKREKGRTKTIESNNPNWGEEFTFTIQLDPKFDTLTMSVYDEDDGARDDLLGLTSSSAYDVNYFGLRDFVENGGSAKDYEFKMKGSGTLFVTISFVPAR